MLYAPNIHQGGGRALLLPLLQHLKDAEDMIFVLDARLQLPESCPLTGQVYRVKPTLLARLWFEWRLRGLIKPDTWVLCMGNLPPLIAHQGFQQVFVQNRYLIDDVTLGSFPWSVRLRLTVERWWLRSRAKYVQHFIVQTGCMRRKLKHALGVDAIDLPFASLPGARQQMDQAKEYDFIYVASGDPHKNHRVLIEAWELLATEGLFPSLCLTVSASAFSELVAWIDERKKACDLNLVNLGTVKTDAVMALYARADTLIYPSVLESFGLPLLEAKDAGLQIVASELDYVRDILDPDESFDPYSAISITRAVKRVMNIEADPLHILSAKEFFDQLQ